VVTVSVLTSLGFLFASSASLANESSDMRSTTDPFEQIVPMSDEELLQARGGFFVSGYLLDFGIRASELTVTTIAGPSTQQLPENIELDPTATQIIINNNEDGILVTREFQLDIAISNFSSATGLARATHEISDFRMESLILSTDR